SGQQLVSGTVHFTVTASSPAGVASISVSQGGATIMPGPDSALPARFSGTVDTTKLPDGPLLFTAIATDTAGNPSTISWRVIVFNCRSVPVSVNLDRTPPVVTVAAAPPRYTNDPAQTVSFSVTADDGPGAGVVGVYAKNLTAAGNPVSGFRTPGTNTWAFSSF